MGMILRIASSRIVGQGDIVGRSGYFSLNLSANSVMRGRLDARRTLKSLVADLRSLRKKRKKHPRTSRQAGPGRIGYKNMILFCRMDAICCFSSGALIGLDIYPSNPFSSTLCSSDA